LGSWIAARSNPYVSAGVEQCLETLRMLTPRRPPGTELRAHGQRHLGRAAGHERELRRLVQELIETHTDEVEVHDLDDGTHAGHGRADRETHDRSLGDRRVAHAVGKPLVQPAREPEHVAAGADVDARDEDTLVRLELDFECSTNGVHRAEHGRVVGGWRRLDARRPLTQHEVVERADLRSRQLACRRDGRVELDIDFGLERADRIVVDAGGAQVCRVDDQGVLGLPVTHFLGRSVALRISLVVTVPPIGGRLDDHGTVPVADRGHHVGHQRRGAQDVVAVDGHVLDAIARGALRQRRRVLSLRRRELSVAVVLAEEHRRDPPHRGEVHGFVERALRGRPIAEERHRDGAVLAQLRRRRGTDCDGQACGNDPVRAEDAEVRIRDVHRAAAAAVRPGIARHQLREHAQRRETLGETVTVAAMRRRDHVVDAQRPARTDGRAFLSDRQVHEPGYLAVAVQRGDALLEPADPEHAAVQLA
jgi:hypothetical protein